MFYKYTQKIDYFVLKILAALDSLKIFMFLILSNNSPPLQYSVTIIKCFESSYVHFCDFEELDREF